MRHKRLDRVPKTVNLDRDLNDILTQKYPNQGSDLINEALRLKLNDVKEKKGNLTGFETAAGRLAYSQTMEKMGLPKETNYKILSEVDQQRFISVYSSRLLDLQSRGF